MTIHLQFPGPPAIQHSVIFLRQTYKQDTAKMIAFLLGYIDCVEMIMIGSGGSPKEPETTV